MAKTLMYDREIRTPENTLLQERFFCNVSIDSVPHKKLELFNMPSREPVWENMASRAVGASLWETGENPQMRWFSKISEDEMPRWYRVPNNIEELAAKYAKFLETAKGGGPVMPTTFNAVSFVTKMRNGKLQLQRRNFVSPTGRLICDPGDDSINGGGMKAGESQLKAVIREAREELGVDVSGAVTYIGDVYDAEMGRTNHVYEVHGYDTLLIEQLTVEQAVHALTNPEGIGRSFMWLEDLEALIENGLLTPISVAILKAFPQLMPPKRPQPAAKAA